MKEFSIHRSRISASKMLDMIRNHCTERRIFAWAISDKMINDKKVFVLYIEWWEDK
jgi:hypothetical protein